MAITRYDYFYDAQQIRFLEQVVRAFSGFQYQIGQRGDIGPQLVLVPCRLAETNIQQAVIRSNNSENTLMSAPLITVWQTDLQPDLSRQQAPTHTSKVMVQERKRDPVTGHYTGEAGNTYEVERLMPRACIMKIQVDIWTSNLLQKNQLIEQIYPIFFPYIEIQNSDNPLDWAAKTQMIMDDMTLSSRSMPIGNSDEIDICTMRFSIPMWMNLPAKVTRQRIIEQINTNIGSATSGKVEEIVANIGDGSTRLSSGFITPGQYSLRIENGVAILLNSKGGDLDENGNPMNWSDVFHKYGPLRPTLSRLTLKNMRNLDSDIGVVGSLQPVNGHPNKLFWQIDIDTLPANTIPSINGIVNPLTSYPGLNNLPAAAEGQRYLLLTSISNSSQWGGLQASADDIVQYTNGVWQIAFKSSEHTFAYVLNRQSSQQLQWGESGWVLAIDGDYSAGYWKLSV